MCARTDQRRATEDDCRPKLLKNLNFKVANNVIKLFRLVIPKVEMLIYGSVQRFEQI